MYQEDEIKQTKKISYNEALSKCARLCSRAEYCISDIKRKVCNWGISCEEAEELINYLCRNRYIDETRYAQCYVSDKIKIKKWGCIKIRYSLRQKGIPDSIINDVLYEYDEELYQQNLIEILRSKLKQKKATNLDIRTRASLYNFATSRGFNSDEINRALKKICNNEI